MATLASDILRKASVQLNDESFTRWPMAELLGWINEGQRVIVVAKPEVFSTSYVFQLIAGTLQRLPPNQTPRLLSLLGVTRNITSAVDAEPRIAGRAIRRTTREALDAADPDWHAMTPSPVVRQFAYDEATPLEFYVYPPNDGVGKIETQVGRLPKMVEIDEDDDAASIDSYDIAVDTPDEYAPVLLDYVLFRAFSKDDVAGNVSRASLHLQLVTSFLGVKIQAEAKTNPNAKQGGA